MQQELRELALKSHYMYFVTVLLLTVAEMCWTQKPSWFSNVLNFLVSWEVTELLKLHGVHELNFKYFWVQKTLTRKNAVKCFWIHVYW